MELIKIGRKTHASIAKEYAKEWTDLLGGQRRVLADDITELLDAVAQRASEKAQKETK
jgi:hypothetical protein